MDEEGNDREVRPEQGGTPDVHDDVLTVEAFTDLVSSYRGKISDVLKSLKRQDDKNIQTKIESLQKELHQLHHKFKDHINTAVATEACKREIASTLEEQLFRKLPEVLKRLGHSESYHSLDKEEIKALQKRMRSYETVLDRKNAQIEKNKKRIAALEKAGSDGTLTWKITDFSRKRQDGEFLDSPLIFTRQGGYEMRVRIYPNGDGKGSGTHVSLSLLMMRGEFDQILDWPFKPEITAQVVNRRGGDNVVKVLLVPPAGFQQPTSDMYVASECPEFLRLTDLDNSSRGLVLDDEMVIKVVVDFTRRN